MNEENLTIHEKFSRTVLKSPRHTALQIKKDNQWIKFSYKELEASSLKVATFLIKEGFKKNDFAVLILDNRPEWAIIYLGIMFAGMTCVPLDPQLTKAELENLILDSTAKVVFCHLDIFSKKLSSPLKNQLSKIVVLDAPDSGEENFLKFSELEKLVPDKTILPQKAPEEVASLIYTSGTTGTPKGVLLTHKNICANFKSIEKLNICFSSDNTLSILPLYHTYAFMVTFIVPLFLGAKVTYFPLGFRTQDLAGIIRETAVTVMVGVPQFFSLLHRAIFERLKKVPVIFLPILRPFIIFKLAKQFGKSLRLLVSGGARLEPKVARDLSRFGFKIIEGYGLTETSPVVTFNPPQKIKLGSVGKPIPFVQIKIINPDKSGIGEVLIKGENVFSGYFKHPDLTNEAIRDGWFYSGDLGYIDKDGYLFLTGRKKDVIVLSSGKNIFPEELEEYYSKSPYIKEICILPKKEERFGSLIESLYAVVVPDLEYFRQRNEKDIRAKIRWELENLAKETSSYKHIMGFVLSKEELPRTALRKIKRYLVSQEYLKEQLTSVDSEAKEGAQEEGQELLHLDITKKVMRYISEEMKKPVYLNSHLEIDLGIDSLTRVELGLGLEALLSIKIPEGILNNVSTVKETIIKLLEVIPTQEYAKGVPKTWSEILNEEPRKEIIEKIRLKNRFIDLWLTWVFKNLFLFILKIFWFLEIERKSALPKQGPYLICANHASYLDGFVVSSGLPFSVTANTFFVGYSDIFERPGINWSIKLARLIPIDPSTQLAQTMQAVSFILRNRKIVCIFPEGRRSIDENIGEFKKGVGILIKELDLPVVPVFIKGSHRSWPRTSRFPRFCKIKVIFGRPHSWKELMKNVENLTFTDDYEAIACGLRREVLNLAKN